VDQLADIKVELTSGPPANQTQRVTPNSPQSPELSTATHSNRRNPRNFSNLEEGGSPGGGRGLLGESVRSFGAVAGVGRAVAGGVLATVLVGASVPVTGLLADYPLLSGQAIRYAIGAVALYWWLRRSGRRLSRPGWRDLLGLGGMVGAGMLGFNAALLTAQRYAEPGFVAAMLGGAPLVFVLLVSVLRRRRPALPVLLGAAGVVLGVVVLSGGGSWHGPGLVLSLLALVGEVVFTVAGMGVIGRLGVVEACVLACAIAAVSGAVLGSVVGGAAAWRVPTLTEVVALLVLGILVTAVRSVAGTRAFRRWARIGPVC
jgi:drug/metabolite transporter (DMT)-like permease